MIEAHEGRPLPSSWKTHPDCPFCRIIRGEASAFKVYEDETVIAFLDILPLRPGHTLVVPKTHYARVSELPPEFAAAIGMAVTKVSHALTEALQNTALNIVCNQEYAQAVHHVHYHIIPAPTFSSKTSPTSVKLKHVDHVVQPLTQKEMFQKEFEAREELDNDGAEELAERIRAKM